MSVREGQDRSVSLLGFEVSPKGVQPRLVLLLLLAGSFAGIWVSHWGASLGDRLLWWLAVLGSGLLTGGLYWRLVLFEPSAFADSDAPDLMRSRWAVLEAAAVGTVGLWGLAVYVLGIPAAPDRTGTVVLSSGFVLAAVLWAGITWGSERGSRRRTALRSGLFALSLVALGAFAWVETGTSALEWLVRFGHVGAFALWVGGAAWHNGIVLPTVRTHPDAEATIKAQAKRFRTHLAVVVPLLFLTGGYQVLRLFGPAPSLLFDSPLGHLVVFKLLALAVLTGIVVVHLTKAAASE